ncbi:MAG: response regulator [Pseudomonadota bacterium]
MSQTASVGSASLRVLLAVPNDFIRLPLARLLTETLGHQVTACGQGHEVMAGLDLAQPQVVIADWSMPGLDGAALCHAVRGAEWGQGTYCLLLFSLASEISLAEAFRAGADDYLIKPVHARDLRLRLQAAARKLETYVAWELDRARLKAVEAELVRCCPGALQPCLSAAGQGGA